MPTAKRLMQVSDSIDIAADPSRLYEMVSDPTRMGEWSPENLGATVVNPAADGAAFVGMVFHGRNRRGSVKWVTRCTVTAAEPGAHFAFRVDAIGPKTPRLKGPIATWEYRFDTVEAGRTRVTETWSDDRIKWPDAVAAVFDRVATRGMTFSQFQRRNIAKTLEALRAAVESR
ncbi:SRPBCC family protein [Williamsia muralis]|uniref:SRPBCC family protein n=1 Tax=Williamsia marianensis TaxID=85044 RepID=A0ABU4EQ67_WILMA|nr:SRPBCC family protein [Williamsia muralis]MDV7133380.1 SRPBCC family protein [Williamsia muralis]